jgi:hypothetical protein
MLTPFPHAWRQILPPSASLPIVCLAENAFALPSGQIHTKYMIIVMD